MPPELNPGGRRFKPEKCARQIDFGAGEGVTWAEFVWSS
jgi:hypothetical protein